MRKLLLPAFVLLCSGSVFGAVNASDNAADTTYNDGWQTGDNGGSGFGAWTLGTSNSSNAGQFMSNSTGNADGLDNGTNGGLASDNDIDTSGRSWGMYANSGAVSFATRPFTGSLTTGQGFAADMDNGYIENGGSVGFSLLGTDALSRLTFEFTGGTAGYSVFDTSTHTSTVTYGDEGIHAAFSLLGTDSYSITITRRDGATDTITGTLGGTAGTGINAVTVFNNNAGFNGDHNAFFNSIAVTPEPASIGLLGLMGLGLLRRRRA